MDSPYSKELAVAIGAVQLATKLSRAFMDKKDKGIVEKSDFSPVTVADFAIQALLTAAIHDAFPDDQFIGEESAADLRASPALLDRVWTLLAGLSVDSKAKIPPSREEVCDMIDWAVKLGRASEGDRVWVFDPIDGTQTFIQGQQYAINVALLQGGKQVLSVVACPLLAMDAMYPVSNSTIDPSGEGCILFAVRGHGTYVRPLSAPAHDSSVSTRVARLPRTTEEPARLRFVTATTGTTSGLNDVHAAVCTRLGIAYPGCDLLGAVPRWAALALGLASVTVWVYRRRERTGKLWDHAGAMLLFEEVGGRITDVFGREMELGQGRTMHANFGFVAGPADFHGRLLEVVRETVVEMGHGHLLGTEDGEEEQKE